MPGIIEGIKIVDMGLLVAAPSAGALLADWGAEVIKIEPPSGEFTRALKKSHGVDRALKFEKGEVNWRIELLNRNKKSLAIDLKTDAGREILYRLTKQSDVFMSNYQSVTLQSLKLDYDSLSRINPRLIYALITAFGTQGEEKNKRGMDHVAAWAGAGIQYMLSESGRPPATQPAGMLDMVAGVQIAAGIMAALLHREKTGKGQELECSLYHCGVWINSTSIQSALMGFEPPRNERTKISRPLLNVYRTRDQKWLQLADIPPVKYWQDFCQAIEMPELANDSRFNSIETRARNYEELIRILDEVFASKDIREWQERLSEYDCIFGPVRSPTEVTLDPQAVANNFFPKMDHPIAGDMKLVSTPVNFRQNPSSIRRAAPQVGQHNEEILRSLGYKPGDIFKLREQKTIA